VQHKNNRNSRSYNTMTLIRHDQPSVGADSKLNDWFDRHPKITCWAIGIVFTLGVVITGIVEAW
jgi:hypothetical protein